MMMKKKSRFFDVVMKPMFGVLVAAVLAMPAMAADNGCDDEDNDKITPELALCSTHAYNLGLAQNPQTDADKYDMKNIIALKTTVMTQQLNKQYEYLESMIRRFKIQLEKAVLTTKLETSGAAAAGSTTGGTSARSDDKYVVLPGVENCMLKSSVETALSCMQSNARITITAVNSGNVRDAYKQLEKDMVVAYNWEFIDREKPIADCESMAVGRKDSVLACAQALNVKLSRYASEMAAKKQALKKD
ncbi:MAG: hypothetical protein IKA73_02660 [Alphaproteobacteria bacterium]|nr:hypothetical protein [Alphaproteobacteria bacterium]